MLVHLKLIHSQSQLYDRHTYHEDYKGLYKFYETEILALTLSSLQGGIGGKVTILGGYSMCHPKRKSVNVHVLLRMVSEIELWKLSPA